jgi:O-antigen/teichoic acid export membrane protein
MKEKFLMRIITQIISQTSLVFSSYFITFYLEVELLGMLAFSNSIIGIFSILVPLSFYSIYYQHKKDDNFEEYFTILFVYKTFLILLNYIPMFFMFYLFESELQLILIILLISKMVSSFSEIFTTQLISKMKLFKLFIPSFFISISHSVVKIVFALNINIFNDPLFVLTSISLIFTFITIIILLITAKGEYMFKKINTNLMKQYLRDTKPLIFMGIISHILQNLGNILLRISYGYETLAYYNFVSSYIISFLLLISGSIQTMNLSLYSSLFGEKKNSEVKRIANRIEKYFSIIFLFVIIFIFLNSELILKLLLPNYLPSLVYLYIMIFIPYFAGINRPYSTQLIPGKKQKVSAIYATVKVSSKIFLILIIVPVSLFSIRMLGLGGLGLALIECLYWFIDCFFYRYFSNKFFHISSYKRLYIQIFVALNSFIISLAFRDLILINIIENDFILLFITTFFLLGLYISELFLLREINRKDLKFFYSLLNLKSYKESFLGEIKDNPNDIST